jgi:hypothetical protein
MNPQIQETYSELNKFAKGKGLFNFPLYPIFGTLAEKI